MKRIMKLFVVLTVLLIILSTTVMMVAGRGPYGSGGNPDKLGNGKGGVNSGPPTSDLADLYGDLVEIVREPVNGIPILDENSCEILENIQLAF